MLGCLDKGSPRLARDISTVDDRQLLLVAASLANIGGDRLVPA